MSDQGRGFRVRALGEIAIRCSDLPKMEAFYRDIIGLELIDGNYAKHIRFFRIAPGFAGHTSVLALFHADENPVADLACAQTPPVSGQQSSLHHLALTIPYEEQDAAIAWMQAKSIPYRVQVFAWVGWRGLFVTDPEGNTVEFVAYDPASSMAPP